MATYTPEQVAAAMAETKVRMLEAGRARLAALVELSVHKDFVEPAKVMVTSILSELEMIVDSGIMTTLEGVTLPMLQEARRTYYQNRYKKEKPSE